MGKKKFHHKTKRRTNCPRKTTTVHSPKEDQLEMLIWYWSVYILWGYSLYQIVPFLLLYSSTLYYCINLIMTIFIHCVFAYKILTETFYDFFSLALPSIARFFPFLSIADVFCFVLCKKHYQPNIFFIYIRSSKAPNSLSFDFFAVCYSEITISL